MGYSSYNEARQANVIKKLVKDKADLITQRDELLAICEALVAAVGTNRPLHNTTRVIRMAEAAITKAGGGMNGA